MAKKPFREILRLCYFSALVCVDLSLIVVHDISTIHGSYSVIFLDRFAIRKNYTRSMGGDWLGALSCLRLELSTRTKHTH